MNNINDFEVVDRISFVKFLYLLRKDFLDNHEIWNNNNLSVFLEALSSYAEDIQGYYDNTKQIIDADKPDWKTFADIFKGARIYE
ncbi:hypothetical protein AAYQ05_17055 [Flavobacterium sp. B11]|uniref:DUF7660 family protein n=1 Tax=Flavobacterium movens TaxID=214860 RepID=UPI0031E2F500